MSSVKCDGYKFDFPEAIDAFKFDETDKSKPHYHGVPMKGVDIIAEFPDTYVFVELKEYYDQTIFDVSTATTQEETEAKQAAYRWLKGYLKYKYRDSYLYRYAEDKVEKPIHYVCLLTFDNALVLKIKKDLKNELPLGRASHRWVRVLASSCQVVNFSLWANHFPKWTVTKI